MWGDAKWTREGRCGAREHRGKGDGKDLCNSPLDVGSDREVLLELFEGSERRHFVEVVLGCSLKDLNRSEQKDLVSLVLLAFNATKTSGTRKKSTDGGERSDYYIRR